jgi:hypothetical protein
VYHPTYHAIYILFDVRANRFKYFILFFLVLLAMPLIAQILQHQMIEWLMNDELEIM